MKTAVLSLVLGGLVGTAPSADELVLPPAIRTTTRNSAHALQHMGLQHRFVSSEEVLRGELRTLRARDLLSGQPTIAELRVEP